jgi:hypothetical protein
MLKTYSGRSVTRVTAAVRGLECASYACSSPGHSIAIARLLKNTDRDGIRVAIVTRESLYLLRHIQGRWCPRPRGEGEEEKEGVKLYIVQHKSTHASPRRHRKKRQMSCLLLEDVTLSLLFKPSCFSCTSLGPRDCSSSCCCSCCCCC